MPERRQAATADPHTVDRGGRLDNTVDKRPQQTERLSPELLERGERDQEVRRNLSHPASEIEIEAMRIVDADNISWLRGVIAKYGWPGTDQVGVDGASAAWLIVQHAPLDLQQQCSPLLRQSVAEGKADRVDLAYLDDRVRTREKRPQVYGTQSFGLEVQFAFFLLKPHYGLMNAEPNWGCRHSRKKISPTLGPLKKFQRYLSPTDRVDFCAFQVVSAQVAVGDCNLQSPRRSSRPGSCFLIADCLTSLCAAARRAHRSIHLRENPL
ncbi:DUF6624 domain-containing protein [Nocardia tengchongensis]|uniref:DUF6624 domain-containing protein n=1 Tax=Nocardia tengchongensis TaxID=2055889 RepID=UPI0036A86C91